MYMPLAVTCVSLKACACLLMYMPLAVTCVSLKARLCLPGLVPYRMCLYTSVTARNVYVSKASCLCPVSVTGSP